jgi:predicted metal-dependent HD superfamily phosphohydrolase
MADNHLLLLQEAETYVSDLLSTKLSKGIKFHTLQHTQEVVAACKTLADHEQLTDEDRYAVLIAAWFHDTGYTSGQARDHETVSIELATEFLATHSVSDELSKKIMGCINATRMPQSPNTTIERIICDADLFHLGTEAFNEKNRLLRQEMEEFGGNEVSKKDWRKINIRFLESHKYFTAYAREKLQPEKDIYLAELKHKEEKNHEEMKPEKKDKEKQKDREKIEQAAKDAAEAKKKKEKESQSERAISTVFRIVAQNQNNLSGMADSKANILISVNAIILSIVVSNLFTKLDANPNLQIPLVLLVTVCVTTIVFSILATRPNVTHGTFTQDDIHAKKTNLLFFGNFYKMSMQDYDWAMQEMLNDKNYLNTSIIKDNYFLGVVLAKKYRFLRIAYNIFMYGLILSMIAFAIAYMIPSATEVYTAG